MSLSRLSIINPRLLLAFVHDSFMAVASFMLSLGLRYGTYDLYFLYPHKWWEKIFLVVIIQQVVFYSMGLYKGMWRFSSTHDLKLIIKSATITALLTFVAFFLTNNLFQIPRSVVFIYWFILIVSCGGGRFLYRLYKDNRYGTDGVASLIIGAGSAGEQLARDFKRNPDLNVKVVGFLDDDLKKINRTIHGISVKGEIKDLEKWTEQLNVKKVFIAIPSAHSPLIRKISNLSKGLDVELKILPQLGDISNLRSVNPEDLLGRKPVNLDMDALGKILTNKVIMITGAGGSIGSELCHQVARFQPKNIILFEQSEFSLYEIERKLQLKFPHIDLIPVIGDVRERERVRVVIKKYHPQIIYHAAAYKHVPMMEENPLECIKTNIGGTKILAEEATNANVERFVMISTDKAVNPTNVMGATKRIAEMICQELNGKTKFMTVRFGNVLGSAGSVIPLFEEQIRDGGPVTVTHPEITRYFMSIPEATQLVMQAGSMGQGGELFVLEMGSPVKIYDLAKEMIHLTGLKLDEDIKIIFTGLRAGEKLYEELLTNDENTLPTAHPLVRVACARVVSENLNTKILELLALNQGIPGSEVKLKLKSLVEEYIPHLELENIVH